MFIYTNYIFFLLQVNAIYSMKICLIPSHKDNTSNSDYFKPDTKFFMCIIFLKAMSLFCYLSLKFIHIFMIVITLFKYHICFCVALSHKGAKSLRSTFIYDLSPMLSINSRENKLGDSLYLKHKLFINAYTYIHKYMYIICILYAYT